MTNEYTRDKMGSENLTPKRVITTLSLFLRVIIEQIWYHFELYPKESFRLYMFYGFHVYSSRHPEVISYLDQLELELQKLMEKGILLRLFLEIYDDKTKKYSFGFSFKSSLLFEQLENDAEFVSFDSSTDIFNTFTLINALKSLLFSIISDYSQLPIASSEQTDNFRIMISSSDDLYISTDSNWILEKYSTNDLAALTTDERFKDVDLRPFKEVNLGYLNIKSYMAIHAS